VSRSRSIRFAGLTAVAAAGVLALPGAASAVVNSDITNGDLTAASDGGDEIRVTCEGGNAKVNGEDPEAAPVACANIDSIGVDGGPQANLIDLNGVTADVFTGNPDVEIAGRGGNDELRGSAFADAIDGNEGNDRLVAFRNPAGSRDLMLGSEGDDTLVWNGGDGSDEMVGGAGTDTIEVNGGGGAEDFTVKPGAVAGHIDFDRTTAAAFNLDISASERLDLNAAGGDDTLNKAGGQAGLAAFPIDADGGEGADLLQGGDGADALRGGAGNDRLVAFRSPADTRDAMIGGEGDDTLVWNPGDGDDRMEGEGGSDTAEVNGGGGGEQFEVRPSAVPGRVQFDRTGPSPTPGPFNLDIGTTERLDLNANGGNDSVTAAVQAGLAGLIALDLDGGAGDDSLTGGDGADAIAGGAGVDTIASRDSAADSVSCGTEADTVTADGRDSVAGDCESVDRGQAADTRAPAIAISRKAVRVSRARLAGIRVRCPASEVRCSVKVDLKAGRRTLGSRRLTIRGGTSRVVRVKLSKKAFALLKSRRTLRVKAVVTATDAAGNRRRRSVTIALKAPALRR
jgi:Ca2+-binding RTX toxin-like protein